ncbi:proton-conducting transporter membrane subunit [Mycobacterium sp. 94-17]|uniref:proton-conducting transporter transmembrane domain-containing protein n=1 Tax=Mycobacterium sp. 94-17 TaxID=2986147 RepID=UPI002D1EADED|nr:proton-conducting transporter membrane subunit [Mycobacterium sp. 94-17]MEB4211199.1 proton-conducting transporter membrane subunit [Mycobacterium sp. 94-17]
MSPLVVLLAALPLATSSVAVAGAKARLAGYVAIGAACGSLGLSVWLLLWIHHHHVVSALSGFIYLDDTSAFFVFTVAVVILLSSLGSAAYIRAQEDSRQLSPFQVRMYFGFFGAFAALMLASLSTGNLGMLFVLIEGSTLASAALVGLEAKASSLEAAWKYIIISSLGVTIALVGTMFLFYSGTGLALTDNLRLTWPYLFQHASELSHPALRLAFLLAVVGYGTKVGLVPMHTWLPDAHSEAPSPTSAMLSAALLNTGMYAIIRFLAIARIGLGAHYVRVVMLSFGFASVLIGVLFLVTTANFKRLFAYSSVEHMGIIAIALGFGGQLGCYGAMLHTLNHAIGKAVLFLTSGDIVLGYRTREATKVRGLFTTLPLSGTVLMLATFAILGSPPFGLFLSEFTIVRAGLDRSPPWLPFALLLLLVFAFVAFAHRTVPMIVGEPQAQVHVSSPYATGEQRVLAAVPIVTGVTVLLVLGIWIPAGLHAAILGSIGVLT